MGTLLYVITPPRDALYCRRRRPGLGPGVDSEKTLEVRRKERLPFFRGLEDDASLLCHNIRAATFPRVGKLKPFQHLLLGSHSTGQQGEDELICLAMFRGAPRRRITTYIGRKVNPRKAKLQPYYFLPAIFHVVIFYSKGGIPSACTM